MGGFLVRLKSWWQSADRTQRIITVFGGGSLVVLLVATFIFASKPKMSLVFTNLSPADAGSVSMEIENMGIPVNFDPSGNVEVPSDKVAKVRATLAMNGKYPAGSNHYMSDELDKIGFITTPGVEKEKLTAIKQAELEQTIQVFDGVQGASVKITPAVDSPFESEKKPAQANVTISEKPGVMVSQDEAKAIANLVASAVPGLDTAKVTIFTRTGRALWDGEDMQNSAAQANNKLELEKAEARKRRDELQDTLNRMLGSGNAIAMVDLTLNLDPFQEESVKNGNKPIAKKTIEESANSNSGNGGAIGGQQANDPGSAPSIGSGGSAATGYTVVQTAVENPVDTTHRTTTHVGGDLKSMAITVLVNKTDRTPADAEATVTKLVNSYLGGKLTSDPTSYTANVVSYPFDTTQTEVAKKAEEAAAGSNRWQQILSTLPIAALLLVGFMVMKSIGKLANRPYAPVLATAAGPALPLHSEPLFPQPSQALPKALNIANNIVLPDIVKQKALEAGISEEQLQAAIEEAGEAGISIEDIPSIKDRVNVPLEQIKKMVHERPETVAMLIKSWLIEEGIRR